MFCSILTWAELSSEGEGEHSRMWCFDYLSSRHLSGCNQYLMVLALFVNLFISINHKVIFSLCPYSFCISLLLTQNKKKIENNGCFFLLYFQTMLVYNCVIWCVDDKKIVMVDWLILISIRFHIWMNSNTFLNGNKRWRKITKFNLNIKSLDTYLNMWYLNKIYWFGD